MQCLLLTRFAQVVRDVQDREQEMLTLASRPFSGWCFFFSFFFPLLCVCVCVCVCVCDFVSAPASFFFQ